MSNGNSLVFGAVATLVAAGIAASRRRGSCDEEDGEFFHVTEAENVPDILANGFVAGWGDVGFGVYFYGAYESARAYARKGGWDKKLRHPVLLVVRDPRIRKIELHEIHGSWDASKYADMYVLDGDEDDEDAPIRPAEVADEGPIPPARAKKAKKGSPARRESTESHAASRDPLPGPWYHGRTSTSTTFDPAKTGDRWANNQDGPGFYFTSDPRDARTYAHPAAHCGSRSTGADGAWKDFVEANKGFIHGKCAALAIALHRLTGLPLYGTFVEDEGMWPDDEGPGVFDSEGRRWVLVHAYVRRGNAIIDLRGARSHDDMLLDFASDPEYWYNVAMYESAIDEATLLWHARPDVTLAKRCPSLLAAIPVARAVWKHVQETT